MEGTLKHAWHKANNALTLINAALDSPVAFSLVLMSTVVSKMPIVAWKVASPSTEIARLTMTVAAQGRLVPALETESSVVGQRSK